MLEGTFKPPKDRSRSAAVQLRLVRQTTRDWAPPETSPPKDQIVLCSPKAVLVPRRDEEVSFKKGRGWKRAVVQFPRTPAGWRGSAGLPPLPPAPPPLSSQAANLRQRLIKSYRYSFASNVLLIGLEERPWQWFRGGVRRVRDG